MDPLDQIKDRVGKGILWLSDSEYLISELEAERNRGFHRNVSTVTPADLSEAEFEIGGES